MRKDGKQVSIQMAAIYCKKLGPSLRKEQRYSLFAIVRRFLLSNGIVMRSVTHKAQEDVAKMHDEALRFLEMTKPMLRQPHRH